MRCNPVFVSLVCAAACLGASSCDGDGEGPRAFPRDDTLRLNQLQALGTHNSYHVLDGVAIDPELDFEHAPLDVQLGAQGVRQFELDAHYNPLTDGVEVYHIASIDDASSCATLSDCLAALKAWSDAHPEHHALAVFVEPKDDLAGIIETEGDWTGHLDRIDEVIRAVWPAERRISPDAIKGDHAGVRAGLLAEGWPTLGESRGKALFVLLATEPRFVEEYTHGGLDLDGRAMFITADPGAPYAAVVKADDPVRDRAVIEAAVDEGLLVRTRADAGLAEAETNDTARRDVALASGAHFISTDFPVADPETGYVVAIPGGAPSRCNPRTAATDCDARDIEALSP